MVNNTLSTVISVCLIFISSWSLSNELATTLRTEKQVEAVQAAATRELKRGAIIEKNDLIKTGTQARASFRFSEGTILTLGENTEMHVDHFENSTNKKSASFNFHTGAFRMVTGLITKTDDPSFTVNTPMGAIGVRGTDFWGGNLSNDQSIHVILLDSAHPLTLKNEYGQVTIEQAGYGTTLLPGQAPKKPVKWSNKKLNKAVKTISFPTP